MFALRKNEAMNYEDRNLDNKGYRKFRSTLNIGMGAVYMVLGAVVMYMKYFGAMPLGAGMAYALGTLMLLYGAFRLWRGFQEMKGRA